MANQKMTIFYKKRNLEIRDLCGGEQTLSFYGEDIEDTQMIYGYIYVDYDMFIFRNINEFYLEKNENEEIVLKMKAEFQEALKKYIK